MITQTIGGCTSGVCVCMCEATLYSLMPSIHSGDQWQLFQTLSSSSFIGSWRTLLWDRVRCWYNSLSLLVVSVCLSTYSRAPPTQPHPVHGLPLCCHSNDGPGLRSVESCGTAHWQYRCRENRQGILRWCAWWLFPVCYSTPGQHLPPLRGSLYLLAPLHSHSTRFEMTTMKTLL